VSRQCYQARQQMAEQQFATSAVYVLNQEDWRDTKGPLTAFYDLKKVTPLTFLHPHMTN